MHVKLVPDIHWRLRKGTNNRSELSSIGVTLIKNKLYSEPEFKTWIASVTGDNSKDKNQILQHYLETATNTIDHFLEQNDKSAGSEMLRKAIESPADPKYRDVGIGITFNPPTAEKDGSPLFKTYNLRLGDFTIDPETNKVILTEQGKSFLHQQFYDTDSLKIMQSAAFPDRVMNNIIEDTTDKINEILDKNEDYKEIVLDWQANRLKDSYKKYIVPLVFTKALKLS